MCNQAAGSLVPAPASSIGVTKHAATNLSPFLLAEWRVRTLTQIKADPGTDARSLTLELRIPCLCGALPPCHLGIAVLSIGYWTPRLPPPRSGVERSDFVGTEGTAAEPSAKIKLRSDLAVFDHLHGACPAQVACTKGRPENCAESGWACLCVVARRLMRLLSRTTRRSTSGRAEITHGRGTLPTRSIRRGCPRIHAVRRINQTARYCVTLKVVVMP
jgi:hypothetical protein